MTCWRKRFQAFKNRRKNGIIRVAIFDGRFTMYHWTDEADALLGKDSDPAVARKLGISRQQVSNRRRAKGIPAYLAWTQETDALLGNDCDTIIAERIGKSVYLVRSRRQALNIPAFNTNSSDMTALQRIMAVSARSEQEIREILTNNTNAMASELLGIPVHKINRYRFDLGIRRGQSKSELEVERRRNDVISQHFQGKTKASLARHYKVSRNTISSYVKKAKAGAGVKLSIQGFSSDLLTKLYGFGFLNKQEIANVFHFDPRYFLSLSGFGEKTVFEIAQALGLPNPLPLDKRVLTFSVTRLRCGDHYDILAPGKPIRGVRQRAWQFFEIESATLYQVMLDKNGYTILDV